MADLVFECRLGYRALRMALDHLNLSDVTVRFNPDDPDQVVAGLHENEVAFFEHFDLGRGKPLAFVVLIESDARVLIERIEKLIRRSHMADFRAEEIGIVHRPGYPDVDLTLNLAELIEAEGEAMRTVPRRPGAPHPRPFDRGEPVLGFRVPR